MDKMFLLGLSLFCLLQGGEPKLGKRTKEIVCSTCEIFKKGSCLEGEGACITKVYKGCRSQSFYTYSKEIEGWGYTHAKLECVEKCGEPVVFHPWYRLVNICCSNKNQCNMGYSLA
ncbi:prostate and testis expressed protein 2 [Sarcophilus harrisii]|uniref:prostate and testis expressed protein 2 n=1 Tax=Sarcophilus harrisii TaxID=9305 RepID=UPI00062B9CA2|nr:prostate and testis expressed protein 2 [Sarcophilus harrisii]